MQSLYMPRGQSPRRVQSTKEAQGIGAASKPLLQVRVRGGRNPQKKRRSSGKLQVAIIHTFARLPVIQQRGLLVQEEAHAHVRVVKTVCGSFVCNPYLQCLALLDPRNAPYLQTRRRLQRCQRKGARLIQTFQTAMSCTGKLHHDEEEGAGGRILRKD